MKSFANHAGFTFLTDVGCQYETNVLTKYIEYLQSHPNCVAVVGRLVTQTELQQRDPSSNGKETYTEWMLRILLSNMFESENNCRVENAIGCIPILRGNCTFYRWSAVSPAYVELYFQLAYKNPSDVGFLMSQLKLAEDSIQGKFRFYYTLSSCRNRVKIRFSPLLI